MIQKTASFCKHKKRDAKDVSFLILLVTKENPRLCRGEKKAYGEGWSRQEKVSELE